LELNGPLPARVPSRSVARNGRARHGTAREDRLTQPTQRRIRYAHTGPCPRPPPRLCSSLPLAWLCLPLPDLSQSHQATTTHSGSPFLHPPSVLVPRPPLARSSDPDGAHRVRPGGLAQLGLGPGPGSSRAVPAVVSSSPRGACRADPCSCPGDSLGLSFFSVFGLVRAERRGF